MMRMKTIRNKVGALVTLGALMCLATSAHGLDKYQDRKGLFFGMGLGGGGVFHVPSGDIGGEGIYDLQLGAGATSNLTLALDIDISVIGFSDEIDLAIEPGPELAYFFGDTGIFLRAGLAAALNVIWIDGGAGDFAAGFNVDVGVGWEFFVLSKFAMGLALEAGYTVLPGNDNVCVVFMIGFKYY